MSAFLKVYTDSGHASEVIHTAQISTTTAGGTQGIGTTNLQVTTTSGMPAQGNVDIDTGGNKETIAYTGIADSTHLTLGTATAISHASGVAVVQWYYILSVGDQTNGIINDGTESTPQTANTNTYYCYNAGNQVAQAPVLSTSNTGFTTPSGFIDSLISLDNITFALSVSPANIAAGGQVQFWLVAEVPSGQSAVGNPQLCLVNIAYSSV